MNIVCLTESLGSGGAERQLVGLASLLKERGYNVTVITYVEKQFYEPYLHDHNIQYIFAPRLQNKILRAWRLNKIIRKLDAKIIIAFLPSANKTACISRFFRRFKLIVSERSHTNSINWKTKLQFFLYRKANWVVANSYSEAVNIREHFPKLKDKTIAIPNYIEYTRFCPSAEKREREVPLLLCVGRIIPEKNVLLFLDAVSQLKDSGFSFCVKWVGSMYDSNYVQEVNNKIKELYLGSTVILQEQTENIEQEYQQADYFCLPSLYEGYPNVLVEAMSCGLSVACSNVCDNPQIVEEGVNGFLFDPTDILSISCALTKLISMPEGARKSMEESNRGKIIMNNSGESFVSRYIELIDKV